MELSNLAVSRLDFLLFGIGGFVILLSIAALAIIAWFFVGVLSDLRKDRWPDSDDVGSNGGDRS
jgi:hypothetical protein